MFGLAVDEKIRVVIERAPRRKKRGQWPLTETGSLIFTMLLGIGISLVGMSFMGH